jgi:hypothetical protein
MIHVVLGMHKSGTTLVSEMLHRSGIDMMDAVDESLGYDEGNKWERESTKAINHEMLGSAGAYSLKASARLGIRVTTAVDERMRRVIADISARHRDWGFKDPRTCLTYDAWSAALPEHRLIVVYRLPEEGWAHYWSAARSPAKRLTVAGGFLPAWCEYNAAILRTLERTTMPAIVLHYTELMQGDGEFRRLERFIGRPLVDRRLPAMHRSRPGSRGSYRLARGLHAVLGRERPEAIAEQLAARRR